MRIHDDEVVADVDVVRRLLAGQRPELAGLDVIGVGGGTDNTMYRIGEDLLIRMPRTPETAESLRKELRWLPVLGAQLTWEIPTPVYEGSPTAEYPLPWAIYRWIEGEPASTDAVLDWACYGRDLAAFVTELHAIDLGGTTRGGQLSGYRGGLLTPHDGWVRECLDEIRTLEVDLEIDRLQRCWDEALGLPPPVAPHGWLHGDLKPSNVLLRDGRIRAVIDFGGLSIGFPDAEHAPTWDLPWEARDAYRRELQIDELTWLRARAWALMIAASGVPYYWQTYPEFAAECIRRLRAVAADD